MRADDPSGPDHAAAASEHSNRLEAHAGAGEVVQARDVHGGVHFHQVLEPFDVVPRQLPGPVRGFVNRGTELASLAEAIAGDGEALRLIVIAGTAGVGKTSLAVRWAEERGRCTGHCCRTGGCWSCSITPPRSGRCARCCPARPAVWLS